MEKLRSSRFVECVCVCVFRLMDHVFGLWNDINGRRNRWKRRDGSTFVDNLKNSTDSLLSATICIMLALYFISMPTEFNLGSFYIGQFLFYEFPFMVYSERNIVHFGINPSEERWERGHCNFPTTEMFFRRLNFGSSLFRRNWLDLGLCFSANPKQIHNYLSKFWKLKVEFGW